MAAELTSTTKGQTLILTLSDPWQTNALNREIYAAGVEAFNGAERNGDVRSVVITGAGGIFNVSDESTHRRDSATQILAERASTVDALHAWIETIRAYPKPVVAAVEGVAAAAGFSLVLACDLVVASRSARFLMPYVTTGLSPGSGACWALAHSVPRALAAEWMMLGDAITAERLNALGFINRLAEPGGALAEALKLCDRLNAQTPDAVSGAKELLDAARGNGLHEQLVEQRRRLLAL